MFNFVLKAREKAPDCVVCGVKLFDYNQAFDDCLFDRYKGYKFNSESMRTLYMFLFEHYPFHGEDCSRIVRHHVDYKKNIQVYVCGSCHGRIHNGSEPELTKWLPVDKKPKNQGSFDSNVYKPLH
jgi:calcineurin-like phosphoesterase family protein